MLTLETLMQEVQDRIDTSGTMYAEWAMDTLTRDGVAALRTEYEALAKAQPFTPYLKLCIYEMALVAAEYEAAHTQPVTPSPVTEN